MNVYPRWIKRLLYKEVNIITKDNTRYDGYIVHTERDCCLIKERNDIHVLPFSEIAGLSASVEVFPRMRSNVKIKEIK